MPIHALKKDVSENMLVSQDSIEVKVQEDEVKEVKEVKTPRKAEKGGRKEEKMSKREREKAKKQSKEKEKEDLSQQMEMKEKAADVMAKRDEERARRYAKEREELSLRCLAHSAVSLHSHMDERVRDLLYLKLPELTLTKLKQAAEHLHYHSLPNLASPYGGRIPVSPPVLSFRSLVLAVGKGHVEYVPEKGEEPQDEAGKPSVHRERQEAFQLLVWGHKNVV